MTGIVTLTPSAAIDHTYLLHELVPGVVNRARSAHSELSGKGVNVALAVALAGHPVSAVLALGEADLALAEHETSQQFLRAVRVAGHTRINTTIIDQIGRTTKVNESPVPLGEENWRELCRATNEEVERLDARWLVLCGSIPTLEGSTGLVPFTDLLREVQSKGTRIAIDTSGAALEQALADLEVIDLLKPNTHELAALTRRDLRTVGDVIAAARSLRERGVGVVYVSMGADGALLVAAEGVWWARAEASAVVNSAGAGDASLAGFLVGLSSSAGADSAVADRADAGAGADAGSGTLTRALGTAASWGALSVSQRTTVLAFIDSAPTAIVTVDPSPETRLHDPAVLRPTHGVYESSATESETQDDATA